MSGANRKLIGAILLLAVLTALYGGFLLLLNVQNNLRQSMEGKAPEIQAIDEALGGALKLSLTASETVTQRNSVKFMLTAAACRKALNDSGERAPVFFMDGAVVRVTEKGLEAPEGFPEELKLYAGQLPGEMGRIYTYHDIEETQPYFAVFFSCIDEALCYIEWMPYEEMEIDARTEELYDFNKSVASIEKAFDTRLLIMIPAAISSVGENGGYFLFYETEGLPERRKAEELGITDEMISGAISSEEELTVDRLYETCRIIEIDSQSYMLFLRELNGLPGFVVAYLMPYRTAVQQVREQTLITLAAFAIIGTVFLVWLTSVISLVRRHILNEKQRKEYNPTSIRNRILGVLGVSAAVILVFSALVLSLFRLFDIHRQVVTALAALQQRIEENDEQNKTTANVNRKAFEEYASLTARIMTEYPGIFGAEEMQTACGTIGAEYLMLFDENGDEVLSNSDFVGLRLGTDASSATWEFRQLLNGVPLITREAMTDEQTRLRNVMIGARVGSPETGYGALLMAVQEKKIFSGSAETVGDILRSLVSEGMMAFSVDAGSGLILDASDASLTGMDATALGLPESALKPGFQDFFTLNGVSCYGKNVSVDGVLYFFAARSDHIYSGIPIISLLSALAALLLLSVLALCLMRKYRKKFDIFASEGTPLDDSLNTVQLADGTMKQSLDPGSRWRMAAGKIDSLTPRRRAALTAQSLFVLCIVLISAHLYSAKSGSSASLINFIVGRQWSKSFNLFAVTGVFLLLGETIVIVSLLKLLIRLISRATGTRGETICRLLLNLVGYAGGIFFVYYALYDLGFAPGTLLASLGLLSFAVSLGAKDLVTDIVAGLSIVFEGTYQVGDIIEVADYRGEVLEIGVRTTKLEGRGGNIKVIANRDVKNVVNMTRKNSWYPLEVMVSADQSLEKLEKLLADQLPRIGASIPEIISGPYYKGIVGLNNGKMTLSIIAECGEADYHQVQRALNRAVQELFKENEIRIM